MTTTTGKTPLEHFEELSAALDGVFDQMGIAEDEIDQAMRRHGETPPERNADNRIIGIRGPLWSSFHLLEPTHDRMESGFIYRAHCAELLDRVAAGRDTRPATYAELVLAMSRTSLATPMTGAANGLYFRVFSRAFPDKALCLFPDGAPNLADYEHMYGTLIDDHEQLLRRKTHQPWRTPKAAEAPARKKKAPAPTKAAAGQLSIEGVAA